MSKRFFDASVRPPRGGWLFVVGGVQFEAYSEGDLVGEVAKWRRNNGTYVSDTSIEHEIWDYLCRREPDRCGETIYPPAPAPEGTPAGALIVPREVTPAVQGPGIWLFLNTLAVQWAPGLHDYFLATCDAIIAMLECPECREEWRRLLADDPPLALGSKLQVCQWVNRNHNKVNAKLGKQEFPYWKMVTEFGAPIP